MSDLRRRPRIGAHDDDEWYEEGPHDLPVGHVSGADGPPDEEPDEPLDGLHGWIYYPDPSSRTGWSTWTVKRPRADKPSPERPIGFTIRKTNRGDPGYSSKELERDARNDRTRRGDPDGDHHRRTRNGRRGGDPG